MDAIVSQYLSKKNSYEKLKNAMINLIENILEDDENIGAHIIHGRVKEEKSLKNKIKAKEDKYNSIEDITDIVGIRIITNFENDIDKISNIIINEFTIDPKNSVDKRVHPDNEFGYKSLHYIVSINDIRCAAKEYRKFKGIKFEIQVRSILQHAWAEIEHDLGYKSPVGGVPVSLKRNFSRLSALLEIADIEFVQLKIESDTYTNGVKEKIKETPNEVDVNTISLDSLGDTNETLIEARGILLNFVKVRERSKLPLAYVTLGFEFFNINTIWEIEQILLTEKNMYLSFVNAFIQTRSDKSKYVVYHAPLVYLSHYIAAKTQDEKKIIDYLKYADYGTLDKNTEDIAKKYINIYNNL